ncbi:glycosyltransferase family 2 protein [Pandoraea bronchicola]|uniref:Glycosyl transferase n=1 Tax=Pandoraea bronchicola TaxID=2508287 RepID=A0A5E5BUQ4_9BURK|nr:glycosyltransferase family 2 protein [Pandoraea bronchicola]VVE89026.1 glycosyl transferase [Pandoraea bronchicola]
MKITIITVTYNSAATVADTLRAVDAQRYPHIEHIIVDGASKDGTLDIVAQFPQPWRRVYSAPDKGIYDAMNKGLKLATGDVIGFLNSDDAYADETVVQQIADAFNVQGGPQVEACYADLVYVSDLRSSTIVRYWKSRPYIPGTCAKGWMPAHPTFYVRKHVFDAFGGFDLAFPRQADFELCLRFLDIHRITTAYTPRVWVRMRTGGVSNNSVRGVLKGNWEAYLACRKNGIPVTPFFMARKILSRIPQFIFKGAR